MIGHRLTTQRFTDVLGRTVFKGRCECMPPNLWMFGVRLPQLFDRHQAHLDQLQAQSRAAHPSARRRTP